MKNIIGFCLNDKMNYPSGKSHRPDTRYAEYIFGEDIQEINFVYEGVRNAFHLMGYDDKNYGSPEWNPLGDIVRPGDNVLIKPNLVMHMNLGSGGTDCLYTQVSVVAAVVDYAIIAMRGKGKISIADAPMQNCDFDILSIESGYKELIEYYQRKKLGITFELLDLRGVVAKESDGVLEHEYKTQVEGVVVRLDKESEFASCSAEEVKKMRITNYDPEVLQSFHNQSTHCYVIAKPVLEADVVINMPKIKTHRKAGVTLSLKNMVGIIHRKECLPHHTLGDIAHGGDEYKYPNKLKELMASYIDKRNHCQEIGDIKSAKNLGIKIKILRKMIKLFSIDPFSEGSWYGNKTISRTIIDLNKILFYADKSGNMQQSVQRRYLIVGDMVVAGEKNGPLCPEPKHIGAIAVAEDPLVFDIGIATLMGANLEKIPTLERARMNRKTYTIQQIDTNNIFFCSNVDAYNKKTPEQLSKEDLFHFQVIDEWKEAFWKEL